MSLGAEPNSIKTLADVVQPNHVKRVLTFLAKRTSRKQGGHTGYMALVLYMVARDHVHISASELTKLETFVRNTAERRRGMSDQTWERLVQFDDAALLKQLQHLPEELVRSVKKQPVTITTAKTVRLALALGMIWDTGLRSGNVVALDLDRHVIRDRNSRAETINLFIPGEQVKNGSEFRGPLTPRPLRVFGSSMSRAIDRFTGQGLYLALSPAGWFPLELARPIGDLKDLGDKLSGVDVTPHLIRALIGKIILDSYPGGHAIAQQVLGHKQLATTVNHYAPTKPSDARALYHEDFRHGLGARISKSYEAAHVISPL